MLYCRTVVKWFSLKGLDHYSYQASVAQWQSTRDSTDTRGRIPYRPWLPTSLNRMPVMIKRQCTPHKRWFDSSPKHHKAVTTCQEERARQAANSKKTRPHSSTNAKHGMRSAGCVVCQSTTTQSRTPQMIHSISITSIPSRSTPNCSSTQRASNQATPAATGSEATKTHQHQSAH